MTGGIGIKLKLYIKKKMNKKLFLIYFFTATRIIFLADLTKGILNAILNLTRGIKWVEADRKEVKIKLT